MAGARESMNTESLQIHAISVSWQPVELILEIAGVCYMSKLALASLTIEDNQEVALQHMLEVAKDLAPWPPRLSLQ